MLKARWVIFAQTKGGKKTLMLFWLIRLPLGIWPVFLCFLCFQTRRTITAKSPITTMLVTIPITIFELLLGAKSEHLHSIQLDSSKITTLQFSVEQGNLSLISLFYSKLQKLQGEYSRHEK